MNELAKILWAFFFAAMFFGIWTMPILVVMLGVSFFVRYKWPDFYEKYLR